jgi:hypothetical protein
MYLQRLLTAEFEFRYIADVDGPNGEVRSLHISSHQPGVTR